MDNYDSMGPDMGYDYGMAVKKTNRPGRHSNAGENKQSTRGASVKSGLSMQSGFHGESNDALGLCTKGRNQHPIQPTKDIDTDHGKFTLY